MFRHKGKRRTQKHNLRLASMLSFVAGIVNISGVLAFKTLTTNVTGHFAFFAEELFKGNIFLTIIFLIFILVFLLGSFTSSLLTEIALRNGSRIAHIPPMVIEIAVLIFAALGSANLLPTCSSKVIPCFLLFAMGLQNSLVTKVSDSVVRTTHLTGLFTDLGIDLSQLFFYRKTEYFSSLLKKINLRIAIIFFFFSGCIIGGCAYKYYKMNTLLIASGCLFFAMFYDNLRYLIFSLRRKYNFLK